MVSARSDPISPAHAPHFNTIPTIIAIAVVSSIIAIVLFYAVASCYASRPPTTSTLSPMDPTTLSMYSTHSELESGGGFREKGVLKNNWSQESLVKAPERAHTMDGNDIPFWEPRAPPVCTKIAASNPKLSPVEGARLGLMHMAGTTQAREKDMKIPKKGSWMRLAT
ncbi:hypothetical protein CYLTODRAFT_419623 [Cylindrobasidium torrendii FP15055 ss-10]|uniref:Uncharacterized protein n=1 Tax=Cylindrobasidium torrendii FP15055 ss-10 TaxID=1314674 RepID=A0A0D7BJC5_9AGAR|nr:hypothetical protein CYLTODRAFT_419623 [Cylindrobasidium torrendii FP15055 ss-10]